jgi:hypothetical protein
LTRRSGRVLLLLLVGLAVPASIGWLAYALVHLIGSATSYHERVLARPAGVLEPTTAQVHAMLADQNGWGVMTMFAVAAVAATLLLTIVAWLGTQRRPADRG